MTIAIPIVSTALSVTFAGLDDEVDGGFILLFVGLYYFCFWIGQVILFVLIRTRSDVRLSRTLGTYEAWLYTLLYALMLIQPLFVTGYNTVTRTNTPSIAGKYVGVLFSGTSDIIFGLLFLVNILLYGYICYIVVYQRVTQTSIESDLLGK